MIARVRSVLSVVGLVAIAVSSSASATAPVAAPAVVHVALDRVALRASIGTSPAAAIAAVTKVKSEMPKLDAHKRGPLAIVAPRLAQLGKQAIPAMVDALLEEDATLSGTAKRAFRVGVIDALGTFRDARLRGLFASLLDDADAAVVRAASSSLGKLGDDESARILAGRIVAADASAVSVIAGAGSCRRRMVSSALASALAAHRDLETSRAAIEALADAGSSWAWKAAPGAEEGDVRAMAAAALVDAFVSEPALRQQASNALMVVDDASTPARIAAAKSSASTDTIAALDRLAERFAKNPAR